MSQDWERRVGEEPPSASPSGLRLVGLLALAVVTAMGVSLLTGGWNPPSPPTVVPSPSPAVPQTREPSRPLGAASILRCPVTLGGLGLRAPGVPRGAPVSRWDCAARRGPYAVVVRRADGSFGRHGAVVTWPLADLPGPASPVTATPGSAQPGQDAQVVTWTLAGATARIKGDLPRADLVAIANRTTLRSGRPVVEAPAGLRVVSGGLSGAPLVHELRYRSVELGLAGALGDGTTFTGLRTGAAFEEGVYSGRVAPAGSIAGKPAVLWGVEGANGYVAWEPAKGVVAYVGYTGAPWNPEAAAALKALAMRTAMLTPAQFDQATR